MELGYVIFIIAVMLFYLVLGCVLDLFGTFILTVPILFLIALFLSIDPVWFGFYVIKTVAPDVPLGNICPGCLPFATGMPGFIALMAAFPQTALVMLR